MVLTNTYILLGMEFYVVMESNDGSVDSDVSDGETDELLSELKKIHRLESHALDDEI